MNKEEIVRLLKEKDDYVSGQELCEYFGVSRTAVWKAIKQLEKDGYQILSLYTSPSPRDRTRSRMPSSA